MAAKSGRKEAFKRPNILRKRNLDSKDAVQNVEFVEVEIVEGEKRDNIEEMTLEDLTMVFASKHKCKKNNHRSKTITLDSYLCEEYKKRKQINEAMKQPRNVSFSLSGSLPQNCQSEDKDIGNTNNSQDDRLTGGIQQSNGSMASKDICYPSSRLQTLIENNSFSNNISILQDQWVDTGGDIMTEESLKISVPLLQVESAQQLPLIGEDVNIAAKESVNTVGARIITCPWDGCSRVFRQPCRLREHWRAHTGARPYRCPGSGCSAAFRSASKLRRHVAGGAHAAERRHACPWPACGRAFLRADHLRQHVPRHHRTQHRTHPDGTTLNSQQHLPSSQLMDQFNETQLKITTEDGVSKSQEDSPSRPVDPVLLQWQYHSVLLEEGVGCARTHRPWSGGMPVALASQWSTSTNVTASAAAVCTDGSASGNLPDHSLSLSHSDWTLPLAPLDLPLLPLPSPDDQLHHELLQEDCVLGRSEDAVFACEHELVSSPIRLQLQAMPLPAEHEEHVEHTEHAEHRLFDCPY